MLKIRQSYHGTGGKEGYKFKVYNEKGKKIGEIKNFPSAKCNCGDVIKLNCDLYMITNEYDSKNPRHEKTEVIFYELEPYVFEPKFDLGVILK